MRKETETIKRNKWKTDILELKIMTKQRIYGFDTELQL